MKGKPDRLPVEEFLDAVDAAVQELLAKPEFKRVGVYIEREDRGTYPNFSIRVLEAKPEVRIKRAAPIKKVTHV